MDSETFKTRMAEIFAGVTDQMIELITGEDDGGGDGTGDNPTNKRNANPAPAPKRDAGVLKGLREACKKNGRSAEFDALEKSGAEISDLRSLLIASIRTSSEEIDTTQKPAAGARSIGDIKFENTTAGKRAGARS